jgi:crossover junction endodeoxyribonuclease RusA
MTIEYCLPFPPSFNHAWRAVARRIVLSEGARHYALEINNALPKGKVEPILGPLAVTVTLHPPRKLRNLVWDVANREKLLFDCLTKSKVWWDDSQVDDCRLLRGRYLPEHIDGLAIVRITRLDESLTSA